MPGLLSRKGRMGRDQVDFKKNDTEEGEAGGKER